MKLYTHNAKDLAILFHNKYEELAPKYGYITRDDTKIFNEETINGKLMISVCEEIIKEFMLSIELPSDEEISKNAPTIPKDADDYLIANKIGFVHGAKWMRDKILNQNK